MRVLGIDPGTLHMGYGFLEGESRLIEYGVLAAKGRQRLERRLLHLYDQLLALLDRLEPAEVAVEEPFVGQNVRSAFVIGQAQAVALMAAAARELPVYGYPPAQVKLVVTGYGAGSKAQVQEMVRLQLGLAETSQRHDAFDAVAVALCHLRQRHVDALALAASGPGVRKGKRP